MTELLAGEGYIKALVWTLAALALFFAILFAVRMIRGFGSGTLIAGGRNRTPRLAVVDATAVDNQRRLVLVRRDDVEHLILIGGPSDLVIEQQIRAPQAAVGRLPQRAPAPQQQHPNPAPAARRPTGVRHEPVVPQPQAAASARDPARPTPEARENPAFAAERPVRAPSAAAVSASPAASSREPAQTVAAPPVTQHAHAQTASEQGPRQPTNEEEALLQDMDVSIDEIRKAEFSAEESDDSIENEMSRLLDDLSNEKKG